MADGLALLGGSFNPLHTGHVRLALEVLYALPRHIARVELIPCAHPPHKPGSGMLPFALRADMAEAACAPFPLLRVNRLEARRPGYSYTWDTLLEYRQKMPDVPLYFILGSEDLIQIPSWRRGPELPTLADFIVVPRADTAEAAFRKAAHAIWPGAREDEPLASGAMRLRLPRGGSLHYLPLPRLDISATLVRRHWLADRDIRLLVPDPVPAMLDAQRELIRRCWAGAPAAAPASPPAVQPNGASHFSVANCPDFG